MDGIRTSRSRPEDGQAKAAEIRAGAASEAAAAGGRDNEISRPSPVRPGPGDARRSAA
ncbi:hypothetical protein [Sorangium sp. So ce1389]|uniref:hypothetical protein n=1 Tax=Sorangium sp. So ce1389 TaxID=3133336 RepID=UPI003F604456